MRSVNPVNRPWREGAKDPIFNYAFQNITLMLVLWFYAQNLLLDHAFQNM
jgi:hypothetical protein